MTIENRASLWNPALCGLLIVGLLAAIPTFAQDEEDQGWPREIEISAGRVVMFQPQIEKLEGDVLFSRAAVMVDPTGDVEPVFGTAWLEARVASDLDERIVIFRDIRVPRVRFPEATPEQEQGLIDLLTEEMPKWDVEMSLDRLIATLELAEKQSLASEGFDDSAPKILFAEEPTVLVTIEGEPQLREIPESGIQAVVNTPFLIVQDPDDTGLFFLYGGSEMWYRSSRVEGPWQVTTKVPEKIRQLAPEDEEVSDEEAAEGPSTPPAIVVVTEPAELIVTDGPRRFTPEAEGELLIVNNSESDVLVEVETQRTFVLLSGRWFSAASTDGPWEFVPADKLPESFSDIDPDGDSGYLLVWVAGTEMAEEAVLDSYVPQTAAVKRDATIEVSFDGEPKFEPIEETSLYYAVNTESQVIRDGNRYYCVEEAIWYVADNPKGPWRVATEVPEEIQTIPASSSLYNTKYVQIYESTPEVVYVGYYPGYVNSYHYHGCLVYGTGWWYQPWWGPYRFYPRHSTWGFHVRWNPWSGWGVGFSYSTGRFTFGIGWSSWHRRGWWGPGGFHGYRRGYSRGWHHGFRAGHRAGAAAGYRAGTRSARRNMYARGNNTNRVAATNRARGQGAAGAGGARSPGVAAGQANNVFSDRNGNVYRQQQNGNWQARDGNQWRNTDTPSSAGGRAEAGTRQREPGSQTQRPSTGQARSGTTSRGTSMNRDAAARQRGSQRARSAPRGGGGGRRGGGGGRR